MLCLSTPAAPPLLATFCQAADSVWARMTLSIRLNHFPPLPPLASADNIRSFQTVASTQDHLGSGVSAPCLALADTCDALACVWLSVTYPPSCLPSLSTALLSMPSVRSAS